MRAAAGLPRLLTLLALLTLLVAPPLLTTAAGGTSLEGAVAEACSQGAEDESSSTRLRTLCTQWRQTAAYTQTQTQPKGAGRSSPEDDRSHARAERERRGLAIVDAAAFLTTNCSTACSFGSDGLVSCELHTAGTAFLFPLSTCTSALEDYRPAMHSISVSSEFPVSVSFTKTFGRGIQSVTSVRLDMQSLLPGALTDVGNAFPRSLYLTATLSYSVTAEDMSAFPLLQSLDLRHGKIKEIASDVFRAQTGLRSLGFTFNAIEVIEPGAFSGLTNLTTLDFGRNLIKTLPRGIFSGLSRLSSLNLNSNHLFILDADVFADLTALTFLSLANNFLTTLAPELFATLTALEALSLNSNSLSTLPQGIFSALSRLLSLSLPSNVITTIPPGVLDPLTSLQSLTLTDNLLTQLNPGLFRHLSQLQSIDLNLNVLTTLPAGLFDAQTLLNRLNIGWNRISNLPGGLFDHLTRLSFINLQSNEITALPPGLFGRTSKLVQLLMNANNITRVSSSDFQALTSLGVLGLGNNKLTQLPAGALDQLTFLTEVQLGSNAIKELPSNCFNALTRIIKLNISDNGLVSLPSNVFSSIWNLQTLDMSANKITSLAPGLLQAQRNIDTLLMSGNRITEIPVGFLGTLTRLTTVSFAGNNLRTLPAQLFAQITQLDELRLHDNRLERLPDGLFSTLTKIGILDLRNNKLVALPETSLFHLSGVSIQQLYLSENSLTSLPAYITDSVMGLVYICVTSNKLNVIPDVCRSWGDTIQLLRVANQVPGLRQVPDLSDCHHLQFIDLSVNALTMTPFFPASVELLNVSYNPALLIHNDILRLNPIRTLDISYTQLPQGLSCGWGVDRPGVAGSDAFRMSLIRAHGVVPKHTNHEFISVFLNSLRSCLPRVNVVDIALNNLYNLDLVNASLTGVFFTLPTGTVSDGSGLNGDSPETSPSLLVLGNENPVQCSIATKQVVAGASGGIFTEHPQLTFECGCSIGFHKSSDGLCVQNPAFWSGSKIAGLILGTMLLSLTIAALAVLLRRKFRTVRQDLEMKQLLLEETQDEVQLLKRAWEISSSEIELEARIDGDSPGAFGEVWRGKWEDMTVAVKVLQRSAMEMDEGAQAEFYREIEFMQRTRHPNIVRFFGAGTWRDGVPFFVVELVAQGSLRAFLRGRGDQPRAVGWATKLGFALDIARGMGYIHSLGQMHRDLKTGNVLITEQNRAKIADFGTVKALLTRASSSSSSTAAAARRGGVANSNSATSPTSTTGSTSSSCAGDGSGGFEGMDLTAGKGTPLYMSPEVIRGGDYNQSADVWSYGVLLWELAAQQSPNLMDQEGRVRGPVLGTMLALLDEGKRLRMDESAWPEWYRVLIARCWAGEVRERPRFEEITQILERESR